MDNNMFLLRFPGYGKVNIAEKKLTEAMMWHQRYGHLNHQSLKALKMRDLVMRFQALVNWIRLNRVFLASMHVLHFYQLELGKPPNGYSVSILIFVD